MCIRDRGICTVVFGETASYITPSISAPPKMLSLSVGATGLRQYISVRLEHPAKVELPSIEVMLSGKVMEVRLEHLVKV